MIRQSMEPCKGCKEQFFKSKMVNLSVIVLASVFFSGFFFRRVFCGWLCPGAGCQLVSKALNDRPIERSMVNWVRIVMVSVWAIMVLATAIIGGIGRYAHHLGLQFMFRVIHDVSLSMIY